MRESLRSGRTGSRALPALCGVFNWLGWIHVLLVLRHFLHCCLQGEGLVQNIDEVIKLCRSTGFALGEKRPANYPEEMFARYPVPESIVMKIIDRLRSDDIYDLTRCVCVCVCVCVYLLALRITSYSVQCIPGAGSPLISSLTTSFHPVHRAVLRAWHLAQS